MPRKTMRGLADDLDDRTSFNEAAARCRGKPLAVGRIPDLDASLQ